MVRELKEEPGCDVKVVRFFGHVIDRSNEGGDHTLSTIYLARIIGREPTASDDLVDLRWFAPAGVPPSAQLALPSCAGPPPRAVREGVESGGANPPIAMEFDHDDDWGDEPSLTGLEQWDEGVWVEGGLASIERYLARHAAFEMWCTEQVRRYGSAPGGAEA